MTSEQFDEDWMTAQGFGIEDLTVVVGGRELWESLAQRKQGGLDRLARQGAKADPDDRQEQRNAGCDARRSTRLHGERRYRGHGA